MNPRSSWHGLSQDTPIEPPAAISQTSPVPVKIYALKVVDSTQSLNPNRSGRLLSVRTRHEEAWTRTNSRRFATASLSGDRNRRVSRPKIRCPDPDSRKHQTRLGGDPSFHVSKPGCFGKTSNQTFCLPYGLKLTKVQALRE